MNRILLAIPHGRITHKNYCNCNKITTFSPLLSNRKRLSYAGFIFSIFPRMPKKNATLAPETVTPVVETSEGCSKKCTTTGFRIWIAVFVVVVAQVASTAFFSDLTVEKIKEFEYEQRGGKETFDLLNKAQILQIKGQLDQIKDYIKTTETANPTDGASKTPSASKTMTQDEIASIKKDSYFAGAENARILAIEYTDPECPFCIRQSKDGILKNLLSKYEGKIAYAHKPFQAVPHEGAEPKAVAALCVGKLAGAESYNAFFDAMMDRSTQTSVMPVDQILPLAKELKVDTAKFSACFDAKETMSTYDAYTAEGRKYGVSGTPGTLLIDTETGKYELIAGAYPIDSFTQAVDGLLK